MQEKKTVSLEGKLSEWVDEAKAAGMSREAALDMLGILWD